MQPENGEYLPNCGPGPVGDQRDRELPGRQAGPAAPSRFPAQPPQHSAPLCRREPGLKIDRGT
ncbi:MAG TPA: hypothetical protein VHZ03_37905 [Trebonia sp.]|nr:hypothetical protein [Trebonia sp.]